MKPKSIFETPRLWVRELVESDFERFHEMQSNANVMKFTGTTPRTLEQNRGELDKCIDAYSQSENDFWVWAVDSKASEDFIGTCAIVCEEHELGYRFLESEWGNGYGQETLNGLLEYAFQTMSLPAVFAVVDRENVASVKILERSKLVFKHEAFNEEERCFDRRYELTHSQWKTLG